MPTCPHCKTEFVPCHGAQVMCSTACRREWMKTPAGREYNKAACAKYRKTAKGKATRKRLDRAWAKTEKGKAYYCAAQRLYQARKKAAGYCVNGGCWRKPAPGRVQCRGCLRVLRERYAQRKAAKG